MGSPARPQRRPSGCSATEAGQTQGAAGHGMMCAVPYLGGGVGVDQGQFDDAGPTSGHREGPAGRRSADFLGGAHERERVRQHVTRCESRSERGGRSAALKGETGPGTPPEACASSQAPPGTPCAAHAARHVQERSVVRGGRTDSRRGVCDDAGLGSRPNRGQSPTAGSGVWHYRGWGKFWEGNARRALLLTRGVCISGQSRAGSRRRE